MVNTGKILKLSIGEIEVRRLSVADFFRLGRLLARMSQNGQPVDVSDTRTAGMQLIGALFDEQNEMEFMSVVASVLGVGVEKARELSAEDLLAVIEVVIEQEKGFFSKIQAMAAKFLANAQTK
ncbi:hypothetical protein BSNK01_28360 [Bacillaceae bacterium]